MSKEIKELFAQAAAYAKDGRMAMAKRRVARARRLAMKVHLSLQGYAARFCRKCNAYLTAVTMRVRVKNGIRIQTCCGCGAVRRYNTFKRAQ